VSQDRTYLDHAATTPVLPAARDAMAEALARWHNPSSPHAEGRAAKAALEDARARVAAALGWTGSIFFTSGATEAAALAFRRCWLEGPKPMLSSVEHDAVLRQAPQTERINIGVTSAGIADPEQLGTWLRIAPGGLVAIQHCNNETGVLQPLEQIVEAVDAAGSFLLADCAQTVGKLPLPPADLIMLSAHKFGGPPGVGALLVRDNKLLAPQGGQEKGYRPGTENLPGILGMAAALEAREPWLDRAAALRLRLEERLTESGAEIVGADSPRIPTIGAYRMPGVASNAQLIQFDMAGIAVSAGSACSSGSLKPSHVLAAMGWDEGAAREVVRVSIGRDTSEAELDRFAALWAGMAARRRAA
jgi:cysteine desulfurase